MSETNHLAPLGVVASFHTGWTPPTADSRNFNGGLAWANISDIASQKVMSTAKTISEKALREQPNARLAQPGDVLFPFKLSLGASGIAGIPMYTNEAIATFPVADNPNFGPRYLYYVLPVFVPRNAAINIYGAPLLSSERIRSSRIPMPSLQRQRAIADYLDRETAEIDGMRADLDEMERLLTERRAAVISETMLHLAEEYPNVQVGTLVKLVSGSGFPHKYQGQVGEELPFYKVGSMSLVDRQGFIRDDRNTISTEEAHQLAAHIIPENSVLMAKIGAALLLGRFVRNSISCCIDNNMLALIPSNNVDSSFLMLSLSLVDIELLERPGPVPTLDLTGLRQNRIPLPPLAEQRRIADEIDRETAEIDSMLEDITKLRDLLVERRAAVISAAVTGEIDIPVSLDDKDEPHA